MDERTRGLFFEADRSENISKVGKKRCMGCMSEYYEEYELCPNCGYIENSDVENALHMYPKSVLAGRYVLGRVIGYGGFGVTYIAWDTMLQQRVAIKEYLPSEFATRGLGQTKVTVFSGNKSVQFSDGKERFIEEAKRLAKFQRNNGIVQIFDAFEENGTAYIVMEYLDGETLASYLEREGKVEASKAINMIMPVIEALDDVNSEGIIHRDIAPDNIFLTTDGKIKLIDFGAARYATTSRSRSLTVIIKPGFSAEEQYRSKGDQGPHTDVYSVGATLYKMITGEAPPDALERRAYYEKGKGDVLTPIIKYTKEISKNQENAIMNALNIRIEDRTADMISLAGELLSEEPVKRRSGKIKKTDVLKWPLWAKIGLPTALVAILTLSVLFAAGVIGPKGLSGKFNVPDGYTQVPDVIAKSVEDAEKRLKKSELNIVTQDKKESQLIPENTIMLQDPDVGNIVQIGTQIGVIISAGAPSEYVVDVCGLTEEYAMQKLEELGFVVEVEYKGSKDVAKGSVISQSVEAGEKYAIGNTIRLEVSSGNEDIDTSATYTLQSIVGMDIKKARTLLAKSNLSIGIGEEISNTGAPEGQILSQMPEAGTVVHAGDSITVSISAGVKQVYVPNVCYMEAGSAYSELEDLGLVVVIEEAENKNVAEGTVFKQSVDAGNYVKQGTWVTITVSTGYTVGVPNVVGKKYTAAQNTLSSEGFAVSIEYTSEKSKAKDNVVRQEPKGGTKQKTGSTVTIYVNNYDNSATTPKKSEVALQSISITTKPTKTYYLGDSFDIASSGMKVSAKYSDGTSKDVTSKCNCDTTSVSSTASSSVIKVEYEGKSASCSVSVKTPKVVLSVTSITTLVGDSTIVSATTEPSGQSIKWTATNKDVASCIIKDGNLTITGVAAGSATITAKITYNSKEYKSKCNVTVTTKEIKATSIILDTTSKSMDVGSSFTLAATVMPRDATDQKITWSSSDGEVVSVSNGVATAKKAGTAKITVALTSDSSIKAECTVTVKQKQYTVTVKNDTGVTVTGSGSFAAGASVTVKATPSSGYMFSKWTSDNSSVANSTSASYTFTMPEGNVTLTASAIKKTYTVTVKGGTGVSVSGGGSFAAGTSVTVKATPSSGYTFSKWTSANSSVANSTSASYTFTMPEGNVTLTASVTRNTVYPSSISLNSSSGTITRQATSASITSSITLNVGDSNTLNKNVSYSNATKTITATVSPSNADDTSVSVSSSNSSVATASVSAGSDGKSNITITGKSAGTATITVKANGKTGVTSNYSVTVKDEVGTWSVDDSSIITVSANGNVTAKAVGKSYVLLEYDNADTFCVVTVSKPQITLSKTSDTIEYYESSVTASVDDTVVGCSVSVSTTRYFDRNSLSFTANVTGASNTDITVSSSNTSIATVSTSKSGSTTTVSVKSTGYNKTGTATITVKSKADSSVSKTFSVSVSNKHLSSTTTKSIYSGENSTLIYYNGEIYAVGTGTGKIKVTTSAGNYAIVTVKCISPGNVYFTESGIGYKVLSSSWAEIGGVWGDRTYYVQKCCYRNGRVYAWVDASSGYSWGQTTGWIAMYKFN